MHGQAVDLRAVIAIQIEMNAGQRRHRAGGAQHLQLAGLGQFAQASVAVEAAQLFHGFGDDALIAVLAIEISAGRLAQCNDAEGEGFDGLDMGHAVLARHHLDQFGAAAADVENEGGARRRVEQGRAARHRQTGFLARGDDFEVEAGFVPDQLDEVAVIGGAPAGFGGDGAHTAGIAAAQLVGAQAECRDGALDGYRRQASGSGQSFAETGHAREGVDDLETLGSRHRHQQPAIVRAQIERAINRVWARMRRARRIVEQHGWNGTGAMRPKKGCNFV